MKYNKEKHSLKQKKQSTRKWVRDKNNFVLKIKYLFQLKLLEVQQFLFLLFS